MKNIKILIKILFIFVIFSIVYYKYIKSVNENDIIYNKNHPALLPDKGIWPEYNQKIKLNFPTWIKKKNIRIIVNKSKRVISVMCGNTPLISYPVALGFNPEGDKIKKGDGRTPEGIYYICELQHKGLPLKYGKRSMLLSYPNSRDADIGLQNGLINREQKDKIDTAIDNKKIPPQNTLLGSSLRIHGGGIGSDWTLGCIALIDEHVIELYSLVKYGTEIDIRGKKQKLPYRDTDRDGIPNSIDLLLGAKKTVLNGANYNGKYLRIPPKEGDVPRDIGVCSDVIIRALRNAGIDLQVEIQKDRAKNPQAYPQIKNPDSNIDHRRVKNMLPWFKSNNKFTLKNDKNSKNEYLPGDIIFMETLPADGPDHIGIISDRLGKNGYPLVINNWTNGYTTSEMPLLPEIPVTHCFRWKN